MIRFASAFERQKLTLKYQDLFVKGYLQSLMDNEDNKAYVKANTEDEIEGLMLVVPTKLYLNGKMIKASEVISILYDEEVYGTIKDHLSHQELLCFAISELPGLEAGPKIKEYEVHLNDLPLLNTYGISSDDDVEGMLECYGKYISHFNGYPVYSLNDFKDHLQQLKEMGYHVITYRRNGFVRGYMAYASKNGYIHCDEVAYQDSRSLITMMCYVLNRHQELHLHLSERENLDFLSAKVPYQMIEGYYGEVLDYEMFNALYSSSVKNLSEALSLSRRPIYFKPYKR